MNIFWKTNFENIQQLLSYFLFLSSKWTTVQSIVKKVFLFRLKIKIKINNYLLKKNHLLNENITSKRKEKLF